LAAAFSTPEARALDLSGLITVNGTATPGVLIAVYDCAKGTFVGQTYTKATDATTGLNYVISLPVDNVRLELYYHPTPEKVPLSEWCREFVLCDAIVPVNGVATVNVDMTCVFSEPEQPGAGTPGYWKNNPSAWPVDVITIGGRTYQKLQAIAIMNLPDRKDQTKIAFRHLVAAKLNVLIGNDDSCIAEAIEAADAWLALHPVCSGVRASSAAWKEIAAVIARLDAYNNGLLCAPPRDPVVVL
jgi:hypothetical protein